MEVCIISKSGVKWISLIMSGAMALNIIALAGQSNLSLGYADNTNEHRSDSGMYIAVDEITSSNDLKSISKIVDLKVSEDHNIRIAVSSDSQEVGFTNRSIQASSVEASKDNEISISEIQALAKVIEKEKKDAYEAELKKAKAEARNYLDSTTQGGLVDILKPDENYTGTAIKVTGKDRDILERLVQGEAGNQGFVGAALVAQAIRDMMVSDGYKTVESVRVNCGYSGSLRTAPNENVKNAVNYIFDQGGYAVKHRVLYFYAPKYCTSKWHESLNNIINYKGHKFFDKWR